MRAGPAREGYYGISDLEVLRGGYSSWASFGGAGASSIGSSDAWPWRECGERYRAIGVFPRFLRLHHASRHRTETDRHIFFQGLDASGAALVPPNQAG